MERDKNEDSTAANDPDNKNEISHYKYFINN